MASKIDCETCGTESYSYSTEEREGLIIACGVKYLGLIQSLENTRKRRLDDDDLLFVWELMIDLGIEKIA